MSETPTLSTTDEQTSRELDTTHTYQDSGEVAHHFERWARDGVTVLPRYEMPQEALNLYAEDTLNQNLWTSKEEYQVPVQAIERIEEARRPLTRAQELEMIYFSLDTLGMLKEISRTTAAVIAERRLA